MSTLPPPPAPAGTVTATDLEHLRLLSIFHYIGGALLALFACIPIIHLVIGLSMLVAGPNDGSSMPPMAGLMFAAMGLFFIVIGWAAAICTILSGRYLAQRRRRTFSIVVAAVLCTFFPVGTVLGVFTIIVLSRDSVRRLYGEIA